MRAASAHSRLKRTATHFTARSRRISARGDITTEATVEPALRARGVIVAKCDCVIAGLDVAAEAFRQLDAGASFTVHDA